MYDFVIIGAGIAGAGVAAMLPSSCKTLLLEKEDTPGYHSTGRSAAIFVQNYGSPEIRELTKASRTFLEEPPQDFSERGFLSPRGVMLVSKEDDHALLEKELADGDGMKELSPQEACSIVSLLNPDAISGAAFEEDAQDIDVAALHQAYLRQAKSKGVELETGTEIQHATRTEECWVIETGKVVLKAKTVINAAGAWVDEVATIFGIQKIGFSPLRRSMAVLPAPQCGGHEKWPMVADVAETWYMKPDAGHIYVSPADETPVGPHDAYVDDMILAEGLYAFEQATLEPVSRVEREWAGLRTFSPDRNPVVGFEPSVEGFFWLAGQGGYGIQTSPAMSRLSAALLAGNTNVSEISAKVISDLKPDRFR